MRDQRRALHRRAAGHFAPRATAVGERQQVAALVAGAVLVRGAGVAAVDVAGGGEAAGAEADQAVGERRRLRWQRGRQQREGREEEEGGAERSSEVHAENHEG